MIRLTILVVLLLFLTPILIYAVTFKVVDHPNDNGTALDLVWNLPGDTSNVISLASQAGKPRDWIIQRQLSDGSWLTLSELNIKEGAYTDTDSIKAGNAIKYRMLLDGDKSNDTLNTEVYFGVARPIAQWFDKSKLPLLLLLFLLSGAVIYYVLIARSGKELYIRRINGLESMDEAVGRATEKGKPILFVPGIGDLDDIQTIAGLTILSQLAYKAATYNADLLVPVSKSMVLSTAREVVREAFLKAGKPDAYKDDCVFYLTDDQFGYVAGIDGIMVREQPAANFFLGTFYAEALILAETGFGTGAMQTAGTAQPHQLPFFVVSCDYTLIGEELFAASAYLSKAPDQVGSLRGQDFGKFVIVLLIMLGTILEISGIHWLKFFLMME